MSLASPADLAAYLQRETFTAASAKEASAQLALDIASSVVVARTGQTFEAVAGDVVTLDTHFSEDVRLPQRPVTAVTSVVTRHLGETTTTARTLNTDYEVRGDRLRWVGIGTWPYEVTVTYDHGYAEIPNDVKGATLAVAAEIFDNPEGLARSAIDDAQDAHEWADDSPAERMLKLVEKRYGRKPLSVRLR
jgi:hypothetical protein